ncbi:MAG: TMP-3 domain-containing protein [Oscillospiraceae bacterium]|jgi:tape measure domain-containing protein
MARDVSIAISAKDNFSDAITKMRTANLSFNKDLVSTMQKLDALNKTKYQLKVDTAKAREALKAAEKQYNATGDAADKMARDMAAANYENARRNLNLVSQNARQAEKDILNMTDAVEKADNRASRGSSAKGFDSSGILSKLASAGITKMLGDSLSGAAQTFISSAFNDETGTAVSSVLSGVTTGAAMGSIAGPVGTVIGAAVGAASGAINAAAQNFEKKDDYFKSAVQEQYNTVKNEETSNLESGSAIAAQREQDVISFTTILGSKDKATEFLDSIREFGNKTPFEYDQLTNLSKTLLNYGYSQEEIIPLLTKIGDTGSATGMSLEDMNMVATVLGRMNSTGKVTAEYLNMLMERHIPALDYLSEATGKSKADIQEMVSKGLVPGAAAAKILADKMGEANKNSMELQSGTYAGLQSTLEDVQNDLLASFGEGFNEEAKNGIQAQIETLSGETGEILKKAYEAQGKFKADLQNTQLQLEADAYTSVTTGKITGDFSDDHKKELEELAKDYQDAIAKAAKGEKEAEERAARDIMKAKIIAGNEYKSTEGYQLELQGNLDLIDSIQTDSVLNKAYYDTGYQFGQKLSEGTLDAIKNAYKNGLNPASLFGWGSGSGEKTPTGLSGHQKEIGLGGYATGLNRVPYNNYPALLHEDEKVLTGVEARSQKSGGVNVTITGPVTVRKESDLDVIANRLYQKIKQADAVTP